jgi:carbohydrate ABC transporter ATP-binding protein, CUT1 family (TC 3.A.1.1.-)
MAEVRLNNISKVYDGGNKVVHSVSIDIHDREFVVLVGPPVAEKQPLFE